MRYLPQTRENRTAMLRAIGAGSVDELYKGVPPQAFIKGRTGLPNHKGEMEVERILGGYANQNRPAVDGPFFLGAGTYYHHIPATVDHVIQRSEFLTAYTPYQPEIAQGTLQMIFEFQTFIAQLTGKDVANASMYDGATACTEAALMALRITRRKKIVLGSPLHPHYRDVLESYMRNFGDVEVAVPPPQAGRESVNGDTACVIVQYPDFYGSVQDIAAWRTICDETGALLIVVVTEIVSLGLLPAPAEADIVCGEAQSIGLPMSYGGPHLGFFACSEKYLRQMPGRLCGMTEDADGRRSFVLTLSTREQHIRRDKATSNICTNQGLCALAFTVHMSLLGEDGFRRLARLNHEAACTLSDALTEIPGVRLVTENFFNEFTVELPRDSADVAEALEAENIIGGYPLDKRRLLVCATEMTTGPDMKSLCDALYGILS